MGRNNSQSALVAEFRRGYTEQMSATPESTTTPEQTLEQIETYDRMGWESNVQEQARQFQEETGIDVSDLAERATVEIDADLDDLSTPGGSIEEHLSEDQEIELELSDVDSEDLEKLEVYERMGWNAALQGHAQDLQDQTGVDIEQLADQAGMEINL